LRCSAQAIVSQADCYNRHSQKVSSINQQNYIPRDPYGTAGSCLSA
jgi:hypothetical protein